jgi:type I restriction enzyme S subunit
MIGSSVMLGDVATIIRGVTFNREMVSDKSLPEHIPVLRAGNIQDHLILDKDLVWVPAELVSSNQILQRHDLVMCTSSGSADVVGKTAAFHDEIWHGSFGAFCAVVRADACKCIPAYLKHFLRSSTFLSWAKSSLGANIKNIRKSELERFQFSLPPIGEQAHIAAILDKADNLRRKRQEATRLADAFLRASFLEMVADVNEREPVENLLATVPNAARTGPFGSQLLVSEFTDSGVPVLGIDNVVQNEFAWGQRRFISKEKYQELERYTVRPGDVMVTIMGTTGRVAIAPDDLPTCISTKHLCTLTLNQAEMLPEVLWGCLRWDPDVKQQTQRQAKGAIMEGWNMGIVKGLLVRKPTIQRQREFASLLRSVNFVRARMVSSLQDGDLLLSSLQAQYFQ